MPCLSGYEASPPPPFLAAPLPPPQTQPPPRPENGPRVGGSRRMARRYGPPVLWGLTDRCCTSFIFSVTDSPDPRPPWSRTRPKLNHQSFPSAPEAAAGLSAGVHRLPRRHHGPFRAVARDCCDLK